MLSVLLSFVFLTRSVTVPLKLGPSMVLIVLFENWTQNLYCLVICLKSSCSTVRDCFRHWSTRPSPIHISLNFKKPKYQIFRTGNGIGNRLVTICNSKNSAACHLLFPHDRVGHYRRTHPRNVQPLNRRNYYRRRAEKCHIRTRKVCKDTAESHPTSFGWRTHRLCSEFPSDLSAFNDDFSRIASRKENKNRTYQSTVTKAAQILHNFYT